MRKLHNKENSRKEFCAETQRGSVQTPREVHRVTWRRELFKENSPNCHIQKVHPKLSNINKMKRQRNTQQIKEQDKCPPNQTKKEEIGNLPDKEFRIMIVKMIQNLENKMELQINSLETRIEKMQEKFKKDLEKIKESIYDE